MESYTHYRIKSLDISIIYTVIFIVTKVFNYSFHELPYTYLLQIIFIDLLSLVTVHRQLYLHKYSYMVVCMYVCAVIKLNCVQRHIGIIAHKC